jgi:hypothetical protein
MQRQPRAEEPDEAGCEEMAVGHEPIIVSGLASPSNGVGTRFLPKGGAASAQGCERGYGPVGFLSLDRASLETVLVEK